MATVHKSFFQSSDEFDQWLGRYDPSDSSAELLMMRFLEGLKLNGISVFRSSLWLPTSHPELWGTQLIWSERKGMSVFRRDHEITSTPIYLNTPGEAVHKSRCMLQWRLDGDDDLPYPLLDDVRDEGGTDYLIIPFHTDHAFEQPWITLATQLSSGFTEAQKERLQELCSKLGWKARVSMAESATRSLLSVYLGKNAAERVGAGHFKRGTGETIHAAIWFCDLRNFTVFSNACTNEELVLLLDEYFEVMAKPIDAYGGEILKFIGDAILAVFPIEHDPEPVCDNSLMAAREALQTLSDYAKARAAYCDFEVHAGIALHVGEVFYGNIGGLSRLDFTVIGKAVNVASRVEG